MKDQAQSDFWNFLSESVLYCLLKASGHAGQRGSPAISSEEFLDCLLQDKNTIKWFYHIGLDKDRRALLAALKQTLLQKTGEEASTKPLKGKIILSANLQKIFDCAQVEIRRRNYFWIEPEHMLLAMLQDSGSSSGADSTAHKILSKDPSLKERLLPHLEERCQCLSKSSVNVSLAVLRFAGFEAEHCGCDAVYPQHILAGLIQLGEGFTDKALLNLLTVEKIRSYRWSASGGSRQSEGNRKQPQKNSHAPGQRLSRSKEVAAIFNQAFKYQRQSAMPNVTAKHITKALLSCGTSQELCEFLESEGVDLGFLEN